MGGVGLYIMFILIFIGVLLLYFVIKFAINFIKVNGARNIISSLFKKENKLGTITILSFILIFWLSFFFIYYNYTWPILEVRKLMEDENIGYNSSDEDFKVNKYKKINLSDEYSITITKYNMKYIEFTLDNIMYKLENKDGISYLKLVNKNTKYKLESYGREVVFYSLDKKVEYTLDLRG